jgi:protoheme IX farnesyltransferase
MKPLHLWIDLLKLRIASVITLTGVSAAALTSPTWPKTETMAFLALTLMLASAGAAALNHVIDLDIDARMERTKRRPLPAGELSRRCATITGLALSVIALTTALLYLNRIVALHLFAGWFVYVIIYTAWLKRRSVLNIVIGGLAGSFAALAGGASVRPELCLPPLLLAAIIFFWTPPHFWALAIMYVEDYRRAGIPMLPAVHGTQRTALWMLVHTILLVTVSLAPVVVGPSGGLYAAVAATVAAYYLWRNIRILREPSHQTALASFKASLVYLTLLLVAMLADSRMW